MKLRYLIISALGLVLSRTACAQNWLYDYGGRFRAIPAYTHLTASAAPKKERWTMPESVELYNGLTYEIGQKASISLHFSLKTDSGTHTDDLNHGKWGEEAFVHADTPYGEIYLGQMPNTAVELGINSPDLSSWQTTPKDIADFISNPNWRQRNRTKYYNTPNATLINTDGSSLKLSYLTPEFYNTTLGISYTPENNANDGLTSKFSPYYKNEAYTVAAYNRQNFSLFDIEIYAAYARYQQSHNEKAGGISFYRKGWTLFGSYRKTNTSKSDFKLAEQNISYNRPAGYDGFRDAQAWNAGISYEWAVFTGILSYFESRADKNGAKNKILNLHSSIRSHKNLGFYSGIAWVDFQTGNTNMNKSKQGLAFYAGAELNF